MDYYLHSYTYSSITNQWDHVSYYFPIISIHLWMSPFKIYIFTTIKSNIFENYA
jgi:hypothetical protein